MQPELSLILPAYNEAMRLPPYLILIRKHFERAFGDQHEVLVVDDGSQDGMAGCVDEMSSAWPQLHLVKMDRNRGKGAALRRGAQAACGKFVLFADADGATPIAEEAKLRQALLQGADVAIGSRMLNSGDIKRSRLRTLTGGLFARAVSGMMGLPVRDTQCGFKMFRQSVCRCLFGLCRESGYLIDLELLLHAHRMALGITEVGVVWSDVPGSKVHLVRDGLKMLNGLWRLRRTRSLYRSTLASSLEPADVQESGGIRAVVRLPLGSAKMVE